MKKIVVSILIAITGNLSLAQYVPVNKEQSVQFNIKNLGFNVIGSFAGIEGKILFDPMHPDNASFDVSVDANTVNTDNNLRDNHLRGSTYFDVKNYPLIHFVSAKVSPSAKKDQFFVSGKLTIKNQAKDISFPFSAEPSNDGYLFKGSFNIKRKDFGVGGTSLISDDLQVSLNILAKHQVKSLTVQ